MLQRGFGKSTLVASGVLVLAFLWPMGRQVQAQGGKPFSLSATPSSEGGGGSRSGYRAFALSLPIVNVGGGTVGRGELNLYGRGSLAIEGTYQAKGEDMTKKEQQQRNGESMMTQARAVSAFLARYSEPMQMAGFYYGLGVGYRQETAKWRLKPDGTTTAAALDEQRFANHAATMAGPTGHVRGGYRYVGKEVPLLIGAYVGLRHFESVVKDAQPSAGPLGGGSYSDMTDAEKEHLKRRFATAPEAGLEIGFAL